MRVASLSAVFFLAACATLRSDPLAPTVRGEVDMLAGERSDAAYVLAEALVTKVGPRFAGTEGDARAVRWALETMKQLGLQNVRAEPVEVPRWTRGAIHAEIRAPYPQRLVAVALGGSVGTPRGGIEAEVVAAESLDALQDIPDEKVRGRIVYFSGRMERTRDGSGYGKAVAVRSRGPAEAARKGAAAVLIRSIGTSPHRYAHTGATRYQDGVPEIPAAALATPDAELLDRMLREGRPVRVHLRLDARRLAPVFSANVVGEIPGETAEIVMLGAHLDSWDHTPGANDDAAGVGIVLAAAQRLSQMGRRPHRTLRVVLFANEEAGLDGAEAYARAHAAELERHAVAMEADSGSGPPYGITGAVHASDWPLAEALARRLDLELGSNGQKGSPDLSVLRKHGVPELHVEQDASAYFDVHHTPNDTVDKLDRAGLAQTTAVFAAMAWAASERPQAFGRLPLAD